MERILREAKHLFAVHGYNESSLRDIAAAADMGKSTLYYYFRSKEDIYQEIILSGARDHYRELEGKMEGISTANEMIRVMLQGFLEQADADPELIGLLYPHGRNVPREVLQSPEVRQAFGSFREPIQNAFLRVVNDAARHRAEDIFQLIWTYHSGISVKLVMGIPSHTLRGELNLMIDALINILGENS